MNYTYPNYLCHHGVKGMKWGVRKNRYSGGVTKNGKPISDRKAKKALNRLNKKPGPNVRKTWDDMDKEYLSSKEYKDLDKSLHSKEGATLDQVNAAIKRRNEIGRKYVDRTKSSALKDLGYDDTKAGRDFFDKVSDEYMKKHYK